MDPTLRARIAAAKYVLRDKTCAAHSRLSGVQSTAVIDVLRTLQFTSDNAADVSAAIAGVEWAEHDLVNVLEALHKQIGGCRGKANRRQSQSFEHFVHYGTEAFWKHVLSESATVGNDCKLQCIFDLCAALGLRNPTEPCLKWMTSLWLRLKLTPDEMAAMPQYDKSFELTDVKRRWNKYKVRLSEPMVYFDVLPELPHEYQAKCPEVWAAVYTAAAGLPTTCKINIQQLRFFDLSYGCRGGDCRVAKPSSSHGLVPLQVPVQATGMEAMFSNLMRSQSRMLELALSAKSHQGGDAALPILFAPETTCRRQSVGFRSCFATNSIPDERLALTGSGARITELSEAASQSLDNESLPLAADALAIAAVQSVQPTAATRAPIADQMWAASNVDEILDSFVERRAASTAASRKRPAAAEPETPEPETPEPDPLQVAEMSSKKQKKRQVAAVETPAVASVKTPEVKIEPPAGDVLVLGCAKCRGSHNGCAQCRSPSFNGKRYKR